MTYGGAATAITFHCNSNWMLWIITKIDYAKQMEIACADGGLKDSSQSYLESIAL